MLDRCRWTLRLGSSDASCAPRSAYFQAQQALTPYTAVIVVATATNAGVVAAAAAAAAAATATVIAVVAADAVIVVAAAATGAGVAAAAAAAATAIAAVAAANVCRWLHPSQHALPPHCYFLRSRAPRKTLQHKAADQLA